MLETNNLLYRVECGSLLSPYIASTGTCQTVSNRAEDLYTLNKKVLPNICIVDKVSREFVDNICANDAYTTLLVSNTWNQNGSFIVDSIIICAYNSYIQFELMPHDVYRASFLYHSEEDYDMLRPLITCATESIKNNSAHTIGIITCTDNDYMLRELTLPAVDVCLSSNYNDDLNPVHLHIVRKLGEDKSSGIVIFHGIPGTGKTTYIRHLMQIIKGRKIILLPVDMASLLASPSLLPFLVKNPNSILIIEDADTILVKRSGKTSSAVANILNMSDGILGSALNIAIICTVNCPISSIDPALLRRGRLIASYEFRELSHVKANALSVKLGKSDTSGNLLCDIYNMDEYRRSDNTESNSIGFSIK